MAIRCGHCHQSHSAVSQVRQCAINTKAQDIENWIQAQAPRKSAYAPGPRARVTEPGIYRRGANIYEVVRSQAGRLYAKELNREATTRDGRWTYSPGAMAYLTPEMKMTREQAQEFGRETGICVNCGAELTHPVSIERGMGPICYGKWYDEN